MKLWSKGLGKLTLPFDLEDAEAIEPEGDVMKIEGRIESDKVNWPYTVKLEAEDMIRFTKMMATDEDYVRFLAEHHGWSLIYKIVGGLLKLSLLSPVFLVEMILFDLGRGGSAPETEEEGSKANSEEVDS
jgi:hypothetical protein